MLENYIPEIQKQISELIVTWEKNANRGEPVDIQAEMKILMFGILIRIYVVRQMLNYDPTSIIRLTGY